MISSSGALSPLDYPPIAAGFGTPRIIDLAFGGANFIIPSTGHSLAETAVTTNSSGYADVLNYTGAGWLEFLLWWGQVGAGATGQTQLRLTIDGVQIFTDVSALPNNALCQVGSVSRASALDTSGTAGMQLVSAPGRLPFRGSIRIESKFTTSSGGGTAYKLVKTA